jgi:hypothetical protein
MKKFYNVKVKDSSAQTFNSRLCSCKALTQLENRIRQYYVIQLVTLIVFTIGSQLLTSSHRVCP